MDFLQHFKPPNCCLCLTSFKIYGYSSKLEYRTPYLLKCGHSSCKKCLINEVNHKKEIQCKTCKETFNIPDEKNVDDIFPVNFFLLGLLQYNLSNSGSNDLDARIKYSIPKNAKKEGLIKVTCNECLEAVAEVHCKECSAPYCLLCFKSVHNAARAFKGHTKVPVINHVLNTDSVQLLFCSTHTEHQLEFFCKACQTTICSRCILEEHNGHKIDALENLDADYKDEFVQSYIKANKVLDTMKTTKKKLEVLIQQNKEPIIIKKINETILNFFIDLHGKISNIQSQIHNKLSAANTTKQLEELLETLSTTISNTETLLMSAKYVLSDQRKQKKGVHVCFIKGLKERDSLPCFLVESYSGTPPRFVVDEDIIKQLDNLCAIEVCTDSKFKLVKENELPPGYEIPPVRELSPDEVWSEVNQPLALLDSSPCETEKKSDRAGSPSGSTGSGKSSASQKVDESSIYTESIAIGCTIRVHISHLITPSDFYVQREYAEKKLCDFQTSLRKYTLNNARPPANLSKGKIYLSLYEKDNKWYRVRILDIVDDKYKVFYIDFGNSEYVNRSRIRALPKNCFNIPVLAFRCKLHNCVPRNGGEWDPSAVAFMAELIENDIISLVVVDRTPIAYIVQLYRITNGHIFIDIADALIFREFAAMAKLSPEAPEQQSFVQMKPPPLQLPKQYIQHGDIFEVHISMVSSPNEFFAQNMMFSKRLIKMSEEIQKAYNIRNHKKFNVYNLKEGTYVAARYSKDNKWYRGQILNTDDVPRTIHIFFIDFGDDEQVKWEDIRCLLPKFSSLAPQAIRCALSDIQPFGNNDEYSEEVCNEFRNMIFNKKFKIVIESVESDYLNVVLYESRLEADICINAILVRKNLAVSTGVNSTVAEYPKVYTKLPNQELFQCEVGIENIKKEKKIFEPPEIDQEAVLASLFKAPNGTTRIHVFVKRFNSPGEFYVTPAYFMNVIAVLEAGLQKFYERSRESENKKWAADDRCAVKYNGKWYRAIVIEAPEDLIVKVTLLDEGLETTVDKKWVRPLHQKFMTVNDGVTRCHLGGLEPAQGMWSSLSIVESTDFIQNHSDSLYMCQLGKSDDGTSLGVELFARIKKEPGPIEPSIDEWRSLNHYLRIIGFAKSDKMVQWDCDGNILNMTELDIKKDQIDEEAVLSNMFLKTLEIPPACDEDQGDIILEDSPSEAVPMMITVDARDLQTIPTAWIPAPPLKDLTFVAAPTYVDNDCCVYLHDFHKSSHILKEISDILCMKYDNTLPKPYDSTIQPGDICIAQYHMDHKWYRAVLLEIKQEFDEYVIQFVDYGNVETCKLSELRKIPVAHHIPIQAVRCCFYTLKPVSASGIWKPEHIGVIQFLIVDKNCQIELVRLTDTDLYGIKKLKLPDGRNYIDEIVRQGFAYYKNKKDLPTIKTDSDIDISQEINPTEEYTSVSKNDKDITYKEDINNPEEINQIDSPKNTEEINQIDSPKNTEVDKVDRINHVDTPNIADEISQLDPPNNTEKIDQLDTPNNSEKASETSSQNYEEERDQVEAITNAEEISQIDSHIKTSEPRDVLLASLEVEESVSPRRTEEDDLTLLEDEMKNLEVAVPCHRHAQLIHWSLIMDKLPEEDKPILQYKQLEIPENVEVLIVEASAFLTPTKVILHIVDVEEDPVLLEKLGTFLKLSSTLQIEAPQQPTFSNPTKYMPCCAQFSGDGLWYRAFILNDPSDGLVQVQYVDYGNVEEKPLTSLREIKEEWLELEVLGLLCELDKVDYTEEVSFQEVIDSLAFSLKEESYKAVVKNRSPLQVDIYSGEEVAYSNMFNLGLFIHQ